jgi:hypothetical protein
VKVVRRVVVILAALTAEGLAAPAGWLVTRALAARGAPPVVRAEAAEQSAWAAARARPVRKERPAHKG